MKKAVFILIAAAILLELNSCDPLRCDEVICEDFKALYFFSKTDSTDLILGGAYELDSLHITPIRVDTTKPGARTRIEYGITGASYNALIWAEKNTVGYIIKLDSLPPDTLFVTTFQTNDEECCPGFTAFDTLAINGVEIPNDFTVCCINIFK